MLINKKTFAFVATVLAAAPSSVIAYQGGIRGLTNSNGENEVVREIEEEKPDHRRLKSEKNTGGFIPVANVPSPPVTPQTPQPVGPTLFQQFQTGCGVFYEEDCNRCLYGYSTVSVGNGSSCRPLCSNIPSETLNEKVSCGRNGNTRLPAPEPAPVPAPVPGTVPAPVPGTVPAPVPGTVPAPVPGTVPSPVPPPVPAPVPEDTTVTNSGCPTDEPESGSQCSIPLPFQIQECIYPGSIKCTCTQAQPLFLCNSVPPAPVAPVPTPPVPPIPIPGPEVCSPSLPKSGDTCSTGSLPFVYCCYTIDTLNGAPAPVDIALVCSCTAGDNRYVCNVGSSLSPQCGGTIIRPDNPPTPVVPAPTPAIPAPDSTAPTDQPIIAPVPAPVPAPISVPVPAPVPAPIPMPTPATFAPALDPVPLPPPSASGDGSFCLAVNDGKLPEDGSSCAGQLPAGSTTGVCGGERLSGPPTGLTAEMVSCTCDYSSGSTWMCEVISVTTPAPAPPSSTPESQCPPQDQPPLPGSSCAGYLGVAQTLLTCGYSQALPDRSFERIDCTCESSDQIWMCDGTLTPISSPTLMPAGQIQPVSMVPVPTNPVPGGGSAECPTTFAEAGDGNSCAGVLPTGLSEATCSWSQTITQNGVSSTESAKCTCFASDSRWSCEGSITPPGP